MVVIFLAMAFYEADAQVGSNRITVTYGGFTSPEFIGASEDILDQIFTPGAETSNSSFSGAIGIHYDRQISDKFLVGLSFLFESVTGDIVVNNGTGTRYNEAHKATYPTVLLNGSYLYVSRERLELYARVGVGACFSKEEVTYQGTTTDNSVLFAYQISPIGIRIGRKIYFNVEAGFGYAGIAVFGVGYRF